jgi:hypothetical protein
MSDCPARVRAGKLLQSESDTFAARLATDARRPAPNALGGSEERAVVDPVSDASLRCA